MSHRRSSSRFFRSSSALLPLTLLLVAGCSGSDGNTEGDGGTSSTAGSGGQSGGSTGGSAGKGPGGSGGKGGSLSGGSAGQTTGGSAGSGALACQTVNDCATALPDTKPASCARAVCDPDQHICRWIAKDLDGDGHGTTSCQSQVAGVTIELGDDCDDTDPNVHPGAWDGPEGVASGKAQKNGCDDGKDNNCNGKVDDDKLDDGTTCKCTPDDVRKCSQDSAGKPITFPGGTPQGLCAFGNQTCGADGKWGECTGAVGPTDEICDKQDNDCDGMTDEDDALNKKNWYWDADGDNHGDLSFKAFLGCEPPPKAPEGCVESDTTSCTWGPEKWRVGAFADDCNDKDPTTNPEAKEVCDGADNNCNGAKDEGATNTVTWYRDEDGDGHLSSDKSAVKSLIQCFPPGDKSEQCPDGKAPCTKLWIKEGTASFDDCDDGHDDVHPGAWDGPPIVLRPSGIVPPGLQATFFAVSLNQIPDLTSAPVLPQKRTDVAVNFNPNLGSIGPNLPYDVAARWTGNVVAAQDGEYTFYTIADDGTRLWVNEQPVIDDWTLHGPTERSGKITLTAGQPVPIRLEWFDSAYGALVTLQWEGPGVERQVLTVQLQPEVGAQPDRCNDGQDNDCNGTKDDGHLKTAGVGSVLDLTCTSACDPIDTNPANNASKPCGTSTNVGICRQGSQFCQPDGTWSGCAGEQVPQTEVCDGLDNNCQDGPDDNNPGGGFPCNTGQPGICAAGTSKCQGGGIVCIQNLSPQPELCNNDKVDESCDGDPFYDQNTHVACACTNGISQTCTPPGKCGNGSQTCNSGQWSTCTGGYDKTCPTNWKDTPSGCLRDVNQDTQTLKDGDWGNQTYMTGDIGIPAGETLYPTTYITSLRPVHLDGGCYGQNGANGNPVLVRAHCQGPGGSKVIDLHGDDFWKENISVNNNMVRCSFEKVTGWTPFAQGQCQLKVNVHTYSSYIGKMCF